MTKSTILAALLAALAAAPAWAQTAPAPAPAPAPAADPERMALANELSQLLSSEAAIVSQVQRMLANDMPKAMLADANVAALEKANPGALKAMIAAMEPIMLRHMKTELPKLWARTNAIYANNLSAADLRAVLAFYRSPAGRHVIEIMVTQTDYEPMLRDMASSGKYEVTSANLTATVSTGAEKISGSLTPDERAATLQFGTSPAGRRVIALTPQITATVLAWTREPSPALDAELEKAVTEAITAFMDSGPKK
jgi:hypothetical protein